MSTPEVSEKFVLLEAEVAVPLPGDVEAQGGKIEDDKLEISSPESTAATNSKESTPPAKGKKSQRIRALDNLRAFLVFLLVLQHAILETVAHIPDYSDEKYPRQSLFLTLFVTLTRHNVVGLLFFVSGLSSVFSMTVHKRHYIPLFFALVKIWQTTIYVAGYYYAMQLLQRIYGPWSEEDGKQVSFFAQQQGNTWILSGPMAYILLLLVFDLTYAVARTINLRFKVYKRFVTNKVRYNVAKYTALVVLQFWISFVSIGLLRPPTALVPYLAVFNPTSLFPIQYILAYMAGLHFASIYKLLLTETAPRFSILGVSVRLFLASSTLFSLYRHFPAAMYELSNLTAAPRYAISSPNVFDNRYSATFYGYWSTLFFFLLSQSIIQLFFTNTYLKKDWGIVSRASFILPFIHMFFVMGLARHTPWIPNDHLIFKSAFVGLTSAAGGWLVAMGSYVTFKWLGRSVIGKAFLVILVILVMLCGIIMGVVVWIANSLGLPTPEWSRRRPNAANISLTEEPRPITEESPTPSA
ncbi:hypothetical protein CPB84DRAFT_1785593 [Gymnopilus junonius]|uniref:Acyltransferase 3 domain-containing protein n=1 Tax=Gymnopilus junonius TaxID=109634 RepID=A0A9P5NI57_GYMJU|nr:hypothetical protein CPB84DRAFT_1785593 [Gymnopilus junonius]